MAQNSEYNINSAFGLNVSTKAKNLNAVNLEMGLGSLFDSMTSYVAKYEEVLDGTVEKEINNFSYIKYVNFFVILANI